MKALRMNGFFNIYPRDLLTTLGLLLAVGSCAKVSAQPITCYSYFTDRETTVLGEILPFDWVAGDIVSGTIRSNDSLSFEGRDYSVNRVISSRGINRGNCNFAHEPAENEDQIALPMWYGHLWELGWRYYYDSYNRYKYIVRGRANGQVQVYLYFRGEEIHYESFRITDDPTVMLFQGDVDVEGVFDGSLTISSYRDIGLIGDVRYAEADSLNGEFNWRTARSYLGLVAHGNIIIRNTITNGRENGFGEEPDSRNRHSIVINGSLMALGGSFTFENQNDDSDEYHGPSPDERGTIYFKGSLAQRQRGYLHRDNNDGTGYRIEARADPRLEYWGPPGFNRRDYPEQLEGNYDRLVLEGREYTIGGAYVRTLIVEAGATIVLDHEYQTLTVYDSLLINGEERYPVRIRTRAGAGVFRVAGFASINHAIIEPDVVVDFESSDMTIRNSHFDVAPALSGTIRIDSCSFESRADLQLAGLVDVSRSTFKDCGLVISGRNSRLRLDHVTIAGGNGYGVDVKTGASAEVVNSVVAFKRNGVRVDDRSEVSIRYCDVYGSLFDNFIDCQPGVGTISDDPRFVDLRSGELGLTTGSPCIDAGDPASPRDLDGTRADIGAFWLDRGLDADGDADANAKMKGGVLSASPNPFNSTTVIRFKDGYGDPSSLRIYDLAGREVHSSATPLRVAERKTADHRGSAEEGGGGYGAPSSLRIYDLAGREVHSSVNPPRVAERKTADHRGSAEEGGGGYGAPSSLRIYDLAGREVHSSVNPPRLTEKLSSATPLRVAERKTADHRGSAEENSITWDAAGFPAGIYIVRVGNGREAKSIKLVKVN